jgi:GNAT superfamily N-acetyltransferase
MRPSEARQLEVEPGPEIQVRRATLDDLALIVRYNCLMASETEGIYLDFDTVSAGVRSVLDNPQKGFYLIAVASEERRDSLEDLYSDDGTITTGEPEVSPRTQPVGQLLVTYEWSDWRCGDFWWIQSVYVEPHRRRSGVFSAMFDHVRAEAAKRVDVVGLRLYAATVNDAARAVYTRLGMRGDRYVVFELEKDDLRG